MPRGKVARQSRRSATTGADAKASVQAAQRIHPTTASPDLAPVSPTEPPQAGATTPPTEAEILLGATMWLARFRDWLTEELDLAPSAPGSEAATLVLRRADAQAFRDGLGRAVAFLDGLTVDAAQIRPGTHVRDVLARRGALQ